MRERRAQIVLLIRAFEETDRDGVIVPMAARAAATRRALRVTGLGDWHGELREARNVRNGETVMRRSRLLLDSLGRKIPGLRGILHVARLGLSTAPLVIGGAFALGMASNVLGPERRVNLLALPLLGMLAWNMSLYLLWAVSPVLRRLLRRAGGAVTEPGRRIAETLAAWMLKGAIWRRLQRSKHLQSHDSDRLRIIARSIVRFGALWQRSAGELLAARTRRLLHFGALALALGMLVGMYVRGITLEYRATWESTWLGTQQVQVLMDGLLGPAARILGVDVPDVGALRAPLEGDAAPWIHLLAMTIVLGVVLPRTCLAGFYGLRCVRLAARVPIDFEDGYFMRLLREWRGATTSVEIAPYSFAPEEEGLDRLKSWLRDYFGAKADIRVRAPLAYGEDVTAIVGRSTAAGPWRPPRKLGDDLTDRQVTHCHVVVFNMAQSPESEVQGEFLQSLKGRIVDRGDRLIVVLDDQAFRSRVRVRSRKRERLRAWQRVAREAGLDVLPLDTSSDEPPSLRALEQVMWPHAAEEAGARPQ